MSDAPIHPVIREVTERIRARSRDSRAGYMEALRGVRANNPPRRKLSCGNMAHASAACGMDMKMKVATGAAPNIGIVTSYNDMLSAHQPFEHYPQAIREAAIEFGATAQVAGGTPAMCDGVTQGQPGMELSLFSRDVIAMSTAIALTHNVFDAALMLGVCDKIVPGLVMGALSFGHIPTVFVPAGPMTTGLSNDEKTRVRQAYATGEIGREKLLEAEMKSYHGPGTCTFYGTANSNQMLMEFMGLHVPGSAFINPGTPLRAALTREAVRLALARAADGESGIGEIVTEEAWVNAIIGLHATGGSTNHLLHLIAMAQCGGVVLTLDDFADLAKVVPLLARVYPNGAADVNQFHAAGGLGFVIRELRRGGLLHTIRGVSGGTTADYEREPWLQDGRLVWRDAPEKPLDSSILRPLDDAFQPTGGVAVVQGNLGRAVIKTSAVAPDRHIVEAPARVFATQEDMAAAFKAGELDRDVVVVMRFQGPRANGMPELHGLMPALGVIQNRGHKVALVSDGRLSGASGKVLSAIHMAPEAAAGGPLARVRDGDVIRVDAIAGTIDAKVAQDQWAARTPESFALPNRMADLGRNLFASFRDVVGSSEHGAAIFR